MAQHGYLREYDEDRYFGGDDDDRERSRREERGWRGGDRGRDRDFMFDERSGGRYRSDDDDDRRGGGFFSRTGDEARSWFRDDEDEGSRDRGQSRGRRFERSGSDAGEWFGGRSSSAWEGNRDWPQRNRGSGGFGGGRLQGSFREREGQRQFSSHPDDHYRSWRDKQMQALDRDYEDYCREREQQFHQDFDTWRSNRELLLQQDHGLRGKWGAEQGSGPDEQTFTPETTAVGNTMTTSETHEPQSTTEEESTSTIGTRGKR